MNLRISDRLLLGLYVSAEMRAYPSARLFYWTPVGYSRRKYRELVSRLQRLNLLQRTVLEGAVNFRLTASGQKRLLNNFPALALTGKTWDGFWRVVMFDIPEAKRKERDGLRRRLMKLGFGRLQDSTYLSPYDWDESVFGRPVLFLEAKQKHLGDPKKLADKIWHLEKI
ncbi:CRISPR-associated endonuclease Cas2, partial [Candidatus Beckwithbacteria bacterium CG_4_10_14_0_2_um_filter_47_25]